MTGLARTFSTGDVLRISGISRNTLDSLSSRGKFTAAPKVPIGARRMWRVDDVLVMTMLRYWSILAGPTKGGRIADAIARELHAKGDACTVLWVWQDSANRYRVTEREPPENIVATRVPVDRLRADILYLADQMATAERKATRQ